MIFCKSGKDQRSMVPKVCRVKTIFSTISQHPELLLCFTNPHAVCSSQCFSMSYCEPGFLQGSDMFSIASYFPGMSFLVLYSISHFFKNTFIAIKQG